MTLPHVLSRSANVTIHLESYRADQLKQAARFWIGKEAQTMRKAECLEALSQVLNRQDAATTMLAALPKTQQQVLAIFARYGPKVSGALLAAELQARGLMAKKDTDSQVQTFTLQRPVVYAALESGLTLTDLEAFLRTSSETGLPDNVARTLAEWAGKRESLVLRTQVTLACGAGVTPGK